MTGSKVYATYKRYSSKDVLLGRASYKANKEQWEDLARALNENSITAEEYISFLFSTIPRPFLNVVFKKVNGEYKYIRKYLQFVKSGKQSSTIPKETKEQLLKEIESMRVNVTIEYTEMQFRILGKPKIEDYAGSIYSMMFEYSPAYLSYLTKNGYFEGYEPDGLDWNYFNLLTSPYFERYFSFIEDIQELTNEELASKYKKDYQAYMHKREVLGEYVLEPSIELLGSTGDGYVSNSLVL